MKCHSTPILGSSRHVIWAIALMVASTTAITPVWGQASPTKIGEQKKESPERLNVKFPEIRDALAKRVKVDQDTRFELIPVMNKTDEASVAKRNEIIQRLAQCDAENTKWLGEQIEQHGWLGKKLVGADGAHNAWLLVQHADHNLKFQKKCLDLMGKMPAGEVAGKDIAYLTDRVLAAEGKPQRYGTQCVMENGKAVVKKVEDPDNLDQRREKLGLPPIAEYLRFVEEMYSRQGQTKDK